MKKGGGGSFLGEGVGRRMQLDSDDEVNGTDEIQAGEDGSSQYQSMKPSNSTQSDGTQSGGYQRRGRTSGYVAKRRGIC